jgi:acyl carrier protein
VLEEVAEVLGQSPEDLVPEQLLQDDLGIDSVMLLELKCGLERRYPALTDVPLADVLLGCGTIGELADRVADLAPWSQVASAGRTTPLPAQALVDPLVR